MNRAIVSLIEEERRERDRTIAAVLLSILFHLVLFLLAIALLSIPRSVPEEEIAEKSDAPIELTILEPPAPEQRDFIDSRDLIASATPPPDTALESDRDTVAASTSSGDGPENLPNQEGEESPSIAVADRNFSLGETPARPGGPPQQPAPSEPPPPPSEPQEPSPEAQSENEPPEPEPQATPPEPPPNNVQLLEPRIRKPQRAEVQPDPPQPPNPPGAPGYQPETRVTRIQGGINNRDRRNSLAAQATPLGQYKKMVSDAIGSRWYYYVNQSLDLVSIGSVEIRFIVNRSGEVDKVRVLSNTANESLASASVGSIMDANIPPIPDEVAQTLDGERLEIDFTFSILH